jgi:competence protein ComEC
MKRMLLGFGVGVLLASIWPMLSLLLSPFGLIVGAFSRSQYSRLGFAFLAGCLWVGCHGLSIQQQAIGVEQGRQQWQLQGEVGRVSAQQGRVEFDFYPEGPFNKLKVSCYKCPLAISQGDQWALALKLKPIVSFHNPNGFNYRQWMLAKGYSAQASVAVKHAYNHKLVSSRSGLAKKIDDLIPGSLFPVLRALLLGDKKAMPAHYKRLINGSGLGHLFVVSGLHVGIVAMLFAIVLLYLQRPLLLAFWPFSTIFAVSSSLGVGLFYAFVSGFKIPAMRACIMLLFAAVLLLQRRHSHTVHYLLLAFILVVIIDPLAFSDMGSWLSFGIVTALIVGMSASLRKSWGAHLLSAQWLAFLFGGVILLAFSMSLAPMGFFLNLLFIPLISLLILPLALLALLLALWGNAALLVAVEGGLQGLFDYLLVHQRVLTFTPPIHDDNRALVIMGLAALLLPKALGSRYLGAACLLVALWLPIQRPAEGGFSVMVLDVGQGSSALIETAKHTVLVDTGTQFLSGMTLADYVVLPYLRTRNINQLNMLHISHNDKDHAGGIELLRPFSQEVITQHNCNNEHWYWDGVYFERFKASLFTRGNNGSCLLKVVAKNGKTLLLTGDIEVEAERMLLMESKDKLAAHVLVVPHHGSRTSSSEEFLKAVNPEIAIISSGALNHYGHPHKEVVQRLNEKLVEVYTTASNGAIQVDFEPRQEGLSVSTYRPN